MKHARAWLGALLALALIAWVLARVDWRAFGAVFARVPYPLFLGFVVVFVVALLLADTFATARIYRRWAPALGHRELFVVRGASYLPSLVNHHLGQAWLTLMIARRHGVDLRRMAGATLLVYASWGGCILALAAVSVLAAGLPPGWLAVPLGLGLAYLALLALAPPRLARARLFAPLFAAGVGGHLQAMALRLPHLAVLFAGTWIPLWLFEVRVPLAAALTYVPVVMVAVTLPITPQGLGTRDALAAAFFTQYAAGASDEARRAAVAASTTGTAAALVLVELVVALLCLRRQRLDQKQEGSSLPAKTLVQ